MTDLEFEILDQLYFVTPFQAIADESGLSSSVVKSVLWTMISKGWVKCLSNPELEVQIDHDEFRLNYSKYHYLATKKGLFEHNAK